MFLLFPSHCRVVCNIHFMQFPQLFLTYAFLACLFKRINSLHILDLFCVCSVQHYVLFFQTIMCSFCSWMVKHMITLAQVGLCGIWKIGLFPWSLALQQHRNLHHCIFTTLNYLLNLDKFPLLGVSEAIKPLCTSTSTLTHPTLFLIGMRWVDWYFVFMQKISFTNISL